VEEAANNSLLQEAAQPPTPTIVYLKHVMKIHLEIKKLLAEKRKARLSNHLKSKLQRMMTNSLKNYASSLSRYDHSSRKPIKSSHKPILTSPPLRLETPTPDRWAKRDKK
jgi:hypothetical protein